MSTQTTTTKTYIREVQVSYGRKRLSAPVRSADDVARLVRKLLPNNAQEHFWVLHLDGNHELTSYEIVTSGLANAAHVHPREVFRSAILSNSCSVIVGHNHPSDHCQPSDEDRQVTRKLKSAAEILGIKLLDHVIVGDSAHYSFTEAGTL